MKFDRSDMTIDFGPYAWLVGWIAFLVTVTILGGAIVYFLFVDASSMPSFFAAMIVTYLLVKLPARMPKKLRKVIELVFWVFILVSLIQYLVP